MKYKTLFRLGVKAIGLVTSLIGLSQVAWAVGLAIEMSAGSSTVYPGAYSQVAAAVIQSALGVYLFFGGEWIVNLAIPSNRPYCPECAYDLTGAAEARCPECGTAFRWEDVRPKGEVPRSTVE